jgi:hypothetical protein
MNKLETKGKALYIMAKEAGASAKTHSTSIGDLKKEWRLMTRSLLVMRPGSRGAISEGTSQRQVQS